MVRSDGYRLGVAFDGDGDRAIFVDAGGRILDGDHVLLMCAKQMKAEGRLRGNAVVATVMSNIGLELALKKLDIELVRTAVGDKYVMEEMQKRNLSLGGEQSGHIIFSDYLFTGDGLITALNVLRTMAVTGRELGDLADDLTTYPQVLMNVRVREKPDLTTVPGGCRRDRRSGEAAGRQRPPAGPLFGHRAAAAGDARRPGQGRDRSHGRAKLCDVVKKHPGMINLSVNVNKVATLRNSRGGRVPSVLDAVRVCVEAGAPGITVHPRADERHITPADVREIAEQLKSLSTAVEYNMEGDPRPGFLDLVAEVRPTQCTLVPVKPGEITSQAGWSPYDAGRGPWKGGR